jgi:hypothetical protein
MAKKDLNSPTSPWSPTWSLVPHLALPCHDYSNQEAFSHGAAKEDKSYGCFFPLVVWSLATEDWCSKWLLDHSKSVNAVIPPLQESSEPVVDLAIFWEPA